MFDWVIKNGSVVSHLTRRVIDIGIVGHKIVKLGHGLKGRQVIDASGLIVSPGFIDMHTHSDVSYILHETNDSKLFQGVTTEMVGCCGLTHYPYVGKEPLKLYESPSLTDFIRTYNAPKAIHWGSFVGHGPIRLSVVGEKGRAATKSEQKMMAEILDRELSSGAFGLSLGLAYAPGMFADTQELIELAKVVNKHGKIISAHIRNENIHVFEAVDELIEIGRRSGAHVHIAHIKLGFGQWHQSKKLLNIIDKAREEGVHLSFEQYPYEASATGLSVVLPNWVHDGGIQEMMRRFKEERAQVIEGIEKSSSFAMGLDRVIVVTTKGMYPQWDGLSVRDISSLLKISEAETVIYLLEQMACDVPTIRFTMEPRDVVAILKRKDAAIVSDGSAFPLLPSKINGMPHPRSFGTFPRFLRMNREGQWMTLEEALYKMTGLPAKLLKLSNKGNIVEGFDADLTLFDEKLIEDTATYDFSVSKPNGIHYVMVNGEIVVDRGVLTKERPGEVLLSS